MKLFFLISLLISSTLLYATTIDCNLNEKLSKKQLKALKHAYNIDRIGFNREIFGADVYEVSILKNRANEQLVVFLGETHIKGPRSAFIGSLVAKRFNVRSLEGVPQTEMDVMKKMYPDLYSSVTWKRNLMKYIFLMPFNSTIDAASKHGEYPSIKLLNEAVAGTSLEEDYTQEDRYNVQQVLGKIVTPQLNIPIEFGAFIEPSDQDSYILDERNVRMAKNIALISDLTAARGAQLVIVGAAHLRGLLNLLRADGKFDRCSYQP